MLARVMMLIAATGINNAYADTIDEYSKQNAVASLSTKGETIEFSINSTVDMHACEISGTAIIINSHRAVYTSSDDRDKCAVILNIDEDTVRITTNSCESYCGLSAEGSMDGVYKSAKFSEASQPNQLYLEGAVSAGFVKAAEIANARGAIMVDPDTRLDRTVAGPGAQLTYLYSFPGHSSHDLSRDWLLANAHPIVKKGVCGSDEMKSSLENGGIYIFSYSGSDGIEIARFKVSKQDCSYP